MNVQEYLKINGWQKLKDEFSIILNAHPELPLTILNYDQIESPKTHLITRECRALVLNNKNFDLVARSFPRFFNWGEVQEEMSLFNWENFEIHEKLDGSLVIFYNFDSQWRVNTRGSWANLPICNEWQAKFHKISPDFTWEQAILQALNLKSLQDLTLDPKITWVCEFCSPWNKIVHHYATPRLYLLTCFDGENEIGPRKNDFFLEVPKLSFKSIDEIIDFVNNQPDATWEGCVIKDDRNNRWKIKNRRYLSLHRMKGNGDNLFKPSILLPFILENEGGELISIYPEVEECFHEYKNIVDKAYKELEDLWNSVKHIENQKEFALSIIGKTKFASILFETKKSGNLKKEWLKYPEKICKILF